MCEDLLIGMLPEATALPDRCWWDDGYTDPPAPELVGISGFMFDCNNAVIDTFYNFTWKGQEIVQLNATIILGKLNFIHTEKPKQLNYILLSKLMFFCFRECSIAGA